MRVMHVVGTRPNFMKVAPLMHEMAQYPEKFEQILVHTGQHYDPVMSEIFFKDLNLPVPDIFLNVGSGSHASQCAKIMMAFEPVLTRHVPDWVVVVGDVNSTLACSLVAVKMGIPVAHVEAGLRSFDRTMPEEINRLITDQISSLHFVSEPSGIENLLREGCQQSTIHFVGNVMIDSLLRCREQAERSTIVESLGLEKGSYIVLTLHRPSNVDCRDTFMDILSALKKISLQIPIIFPVHPRTRDMLSKLRLDSDFCGIRLIDPLGYQDFVRLLSHARIVMTDSGGIQEESTILGIPCLTLRENTERPVTVSEGTNVITGTNGKKVFEACMTIIRGGGKKGKAPRFWDGKSAARIVEIFLSRL